VSGTLKGWALSPSGEQVVAATANGFSLLNLSPSGEVRHSEPRLGFDGAPGISADGRWVAIGSRDQGVQIWETSSGKAMTNLPVSGRATCTFSPDNRWLVTATKNEYCFWEVGSWKPGLRFSRSPSAASWPSVAFTPDGKVVALCVPASAIRLLHAGTDREIATLPTARMITDLCFSPVGDRLLVIYEPGMGELWDLQRIYEGLAALNLEWEGFVPVKKQPLDSGGQRSRSFPPPTPTAFLAPPR
jgi:WD40 repeat protein